MKTISIWIVCSILLMSKNMSGQAVSSDNSWRTIDSKNPNKEYVYIHHNTSLLFAGEYLYYKVYSLKSKTNTLSAFSKIGYVELIGENSNVVFRHKIKLKNGIGQGEFFIPVTVPSGNYKLIAYTQWMKNYGVDYFFKSDVGIINPFQNNQESILEQPDSLEKTPFLSVYNAGMEKESDKNEVLTLSINKKVLKKREQGLLTISTLKKNEVLGNYSISIRKIDSIGRPLMYSASEYSVFQAEHMDDARFGDEQKYLPELRGELITGKITPKDSSLSSKEETMALSIPGKRFIQKMSRTNINGEFYFNLDQEYSGENGFIQILGEHRNKYEIKPAKQSAINYENLKFGKLTVTPEMENLILRRSIYNQLENAFIEMKPDTIEQLEQTLPVYRQFSKVYDLDDYTRFSTVRETASEVLEHVWIQKGEDGMEVFHVRGEESRPEINFLPLVVVDGILIQQHSDIIDFDARKIKRINISREECVINSIIYKGVIAMETIKGDFPQEFKKDYIKALGLFSPLPEKKYFSPKYSQATKSTSDQIPDFRQQLLWLPQLALDDETKIDFYTSDVAGKYEISLEGFTLTGTAITVKEAFEVK